MQPPLPTLREVNPSPQPPASFPFIGHLRFPETLPLAHSFSYRPVPGGSPRNVPVVQGWETVESWAKSAPWDVLRLDGGGVALRKGDQFWVLVGSGRECRLYLGKHPACHLGVLLSVSGAKHLDVYSRRMD